MPDDVQTIIGRRLYLADIFSAHWKANARLFVSLRKLLTGPARVAHTSLPLIEQDLQSFHQRFEEDLQKFNHVLRASTWFKDIHSHHGPDERLNRLSHAFETSTKRNIFQTLERALSATHGVLHQVSLKPEETVLWPHLDFRISESFRVGTWEPSYWLRAPKVFHKEVLPLLERIVKTALERIAHIAQHVAPEEERNWAEVRREIERGRSSLDANPRRGVRELQMYRQQSTDLRAVMANYVLKEYATGLYSSLCPESFRPTSPWTPLGGASTTRYFFPEPVPVPKSLQRLGYTTGPPIDSNRLTAGMFRRRRHAVGATP